MVYTQAQPALEWRWAPRAACQRPVRDPLHELYIGIADGLSGAMPLGRATQACVPADMLRRVQRIWLFPNITATQMFNRCCPTFDGTFDETFDGALDGTSNCTPVHTRASPFNGRREPLHTLYIGIADGMSQRMRSDV